MSRLKQKGYIGPGVKIEFFIPPDGEFCTESHKRNRTQNTVVRQRYEHLSAIQCGLCHVPMSNFEASFLKIAKNAYVPLFCLRRLIYRMPFPRGRREDPSQIQAFPFLEK